MAANVVPSMLGRLLNSTQGIGISLQWSGEGYGLVREWCLTVTMNQLLQLSTRTQLRMSICCT